MNCCYCESKELDLCRENPPLYKCRTCRKFFEVESTVQPKVEDTKKQSYKQIKEDGTEEKQAVRVYNYIKNHKGSCIREIGEGLKLEKSSVCARLAVLKAEGSVTFSDYKEYKGKRVETWEVK